MSRDLACYTFITAGLCRKITIQFLGFSGENNFWAVILTKTKYMSFVTYIGFKICTSDLYSSQ